MDVSSAALRYFCVLAEELHYGRAAARLHITSPSLSQQITRLEARLGKQLFTRSPRDVRLTDAGAELLPLAAEAMRAHAAVLDWASGTPDTHPLRVGIVASGAGALTSEILSTLATRFSDLRLQLVRLGFFEAEAAVRDGVVDVALTLSPYLPAGPGTTAAPLTSEPRVLVLRSDAALAGRAVVRIDETTWGSSCRAARPARHEHGGSSTLDPTAPARGS